MILNWPGLHAARHDYRAQWRRGSPFPHVVLSDLFTREALAALQSTFPITGAGWTDRRHLHSNKHTMNDMSQMPEAHRRAIEELHADPFLGYLERLTGMTELTPDPHLYGGGLHVTARGGYLDMHCDFTESSLMPGYRRALNLLIYLTRDYDPAWGGGLQLGHLDEPGHYFPRIGKTIYPVANRAVLFATSTDSWHGHTEKWASDVPRTSMAIYLYRKAAVGGSVLKTTDYRPLEGQTWKRARKAVGRALRKAGLR